MTDPATTNIATQTPEPRGSDNAWKIFLAAFAGALGSAVAGIIVSATTVSWVVKLVTGEKFPKGAIIFLNTDDCGDDWKPYKVAQGHFVIGADKTSFIAGQANKGADDEVKITTNNLPTDAVGDLKFQSGGLPSNLDNSNGSPFIIKLGSGPSSVAVPLGGVGDAIHVRPPFIPLTACEKK